MFDGVTKFTKGAGTWGMHGIVKIPKRKNDFVFFVTFGQDRLGYSFKETITKSGVLTWQSQPKQTLNNKTIQKLISHNHLIDNIYLFIRLNSYKSKKENQLFTYIGKIAYLKHDLTKEKPVYFKWKVIEWDKVESKSSFNNIIDTESNEISGKKIIKNELLLTCSPNFNHKNEKNIQRPYHSDSHDYVAELKENIKIGIMGEKLAIKYLEENTEHKIIHTSQIEGDGAGYDIEMLKCDGSRLYVEVKTTQGGKNTPFMLSANELEFSKQFNLDYQLFRIFKYDYDKNSGMLYILNGDISNHTKLIPISFKVEV